MILAPDAKNYHGYLEIAIVIHLIISIIRLVIVVYLHSFDISLISLLSGQLVVEAWKNLQTKEGIVAFEALR